MGATILPNAIEESTFVVTAHFTDEDGAEVVPETVLWSLSNDKGKIINNREDVSVTPAGTVNIVLTGDDLAIGSDGQIREVSIEATYNSTRGTGLSLKGRCTFNIENLVAVS